MFTFKSKGAALACSALTLSLLLTGCGSDSSDDSAAAGPTETLSASIRYTTAGVPHITAANLRDAAFASGYVQAKANGCIIADQILRTKGERAKYYGPGESINPPLSPFFAGVNVVSDFSVKALGFMDKATASYPTLTQDTKDLLAGFAAGYNHYLEKTDNLSNVNGRYGSCAGQPWVKAITPQEVFAYYSLVAQYASGMQFATGVTFFASPGSNQAALPHPVRNTALNPSHEKLQLANLHMPLDFVHMDMGSNGWGISGDLTENGKGALLANPHFPYTGARRLFQMQIDVPSKGYNVNGAALLGVVIPLIGFNDSVAWTHTVSTGHHFTVYALSLKAGDPMTYIKDGVEHAITSQNVQIDVKSGSGLVKMEKAFYFSEYGPMLNLNLANTSLPEWGQPFVGLPGNQPVAFTYRDANVATADQMMDQWLQMGEAKNLAEFQDAFKTDASGACSSVLWVNTMYADKDGNAFYIDGTAVPKLSPTAIATYKAQLGANPYAQALAASGITLLDGSTSANDWDTSQCASGLSGYADMPKLASDATVKYVQNSNDSYWATNTNALMTEHSPLYGDFEKPLSARTRMGLKALNNPMDAGLSAVKPAGADGKFSGQEIIDNLYANRAYYGEEFLPGLLTRCNNIGTNPVTVGTASRAVSTGCAALSAWDGVFNIDSVGAAVFRVFIGQYAKSGLAAGYTTPFSAADPANTPAGAPAASSDVNVLKTDSMLVALAKGLDILDQAGIAYNAELGDVQFEQQSKSVPPGATPAPAGAAIPWGGNQNMEGGFNIVGPYIGGVADDTRFPRVSPAATDIVPDTGKMSKQAGAPGWHVSRGTSWHFGLEFQNDGPHAWGLVSYGQSADSGSPHFSDQDQLFSSKSYRTLLYTDAQINADPNLETLSIKARVPVQ